MTLPKPNPIPAARPLFPEEDMPEILEQITNQADLVISATSD